MPYTRTRGIILRCTDYSETSQVVAISTPDLGQVHALAKGSRKPRKDARSPLDLLTHYDIVLSCRPAGNLHLMTEWVVREPFAVLRRSLRHLWSAFYAAEVALLLTSEGPEDGPVYGQLLDLLRRLNTGEGEHISLFRFLSRILRTLGWLPLTDRCAHCGEALDGPMRFSAAAGGTLCGECSMSDGGAFSISRGAVAALGRLASDSAHAALRLSSAQVAEIQRAFNEQIQYHLGKPLRTARFLGSSGIFRAHAPR